MKAAIAATHQHFESASCHTPEYLAWHRLFKKELTSFLKKRGAVKIEIGKPNHFDLSGFAAMEIEGASGIIYFRLEDLRWSKSSMLVREAKSFRDYTGGVNCRAGLESVEQFTADFEAVLKHMYHRRRLQSEPVPEACAYCGRPPETHSEKSCARY